MRPFNIETFQYTRLPVAVKLFKWSEDDCNSGILQQLFNREVNALKQLRHEHVIRMPAGRKA